MTTRFPNGITNVVWPAGNPSVPTLWNLTMPDPTKLITFFDDFSSQTLFPIASSGLAAASNATYVLTVTEAGVGNASSAAADIDGGGITITNDAADNDNVFVQHRHEFWLPAAGKKAWFKARFSVSDGTDCDWVMGMQVRDTTPLDATDGIYFQKDDNDAQIDFYCRKDASSGSNSVTNIATCPSNTMLSVGWYYNGAGKVFYYVNDVELGSLDASSTFLPDTELTLSFGIQNGSAAARSMVVDYLFFAAER